MEKASPPPPPVNLWVVLSESKRIINANRRHFLALSILFLLPVSFTATVYKSIIRLNADNVSLSHADADTETMVLLPHLLLIAYVVVATVFNLLAIGSITYSVFEGFYGRPLKLISAVKSSFTSFFPLLATLISTNFILFGIFMTLGFGVFFMALLIGNSSPYFKPLSVIVTIIVTIIVIKLNVDWIVAQVIVVFESVWGFTPLKRSKSLIKGMKGVALSINLLFGVSQSILVWVSTRDTLPTDALFVFEIVFMSTLISLYSLAANTVMYIYCKAVHDEDAWDITEEFVKEYVSLPLDDDKAPDFVSAAYNNV